MAVGDRPVRSAARRDTVVAEGRAPSAPRRCEPGSATGPGARRGGWLARPPQAGINSPPGASRSACGALHPHISIWGANRSCPVVNFSPVKQVNIEGRWYKPEIQINGASAQESRGVPRNRRRARLARPIRLIANSQNYPCVFGRISPHWPHQSSRLRRILLCPAD